MTFLFLRPKGNTYIVIMKGCQGTCHIRDWQRSCQKMEEQENRLIPLKEPYNSKGAATCMVLIIKCPHLTLWDWPYHVGFDHPGNGGSPSHIEVGLSAFCPLDIIVTCRLSHLVIFSKFYIVIFIISTIQF